MSSRPTILFASLAGAAAALLAALPASAQTGVGGRTAPNLGEIVAIDATGETGWPYGSEDLAGDGATFKQPEQSIDVRTAYAATDPQRFWVRAYVADPNAVGGNVKVFVFIDADGDPLTGAPASAATIDAKLTTDPSAGGYEYVIELRGNGSVAQIWEYSAPQMQWIGTAPTAAQAVGETGQGRDPIQIDGVDHGYLQGSVDLALVGLTQACAADLFFRSVNDSAAGAGDLEVGQLAPCTPADANADGVPDLVVPSQGCTTDAECPGGGICVAGQCIIPVSCTGDADCPPDEQCSANGVCVPRPGGSCTDNAACGDLVCVGGTCVACTPGGAECGAGQRCAPTGRCVVDTGGAGGAGGGGIALAPGDEVRGGAFTCTASGVAGRESIALASLLGAALVLAARRRRRAPPSPDRLAGGRGGRR